MSNNLPLDKTLRALEIDRELAIMRLRIIELESEKVQLLPLYYDEQIRIVADKISKQNDDDNNAITLNPYTFKHNLNKKEEEKKKNNNKDKMLKPYTFSKNNNKIRRGRK